MDGSLDELYLEWLYSQVASVKVRVRSKTYWSLLRRLHSTEFVWRIPNDDNRVEDGRDLRFIFLEEGGIAAVDPSWMARGCSMLELLIVLARALSFQTGGECSDWFWHLLGNLGIHINDRDYTHQTEERIDIALTRVCNRDYDPSGRGGLFPLQRPAQDQRGVELLYQLYAYVLEMP